MNNNHLYTPEQIHDTLTLNPGHFWRKVQRCKADYDSLRPHPGVQPEDFQQWILTEYGIELTRDRYSINLENKYNVVDEHKYLLFELKYS